MKVSLAQKHSFSDVTFRDIKCTTGKYLVKCSRRSTLFTQMIKHEQFCGDFCWSIFVDYVINSTQNGEKNVLKVSSMMI